MTLLSIDFPVLDFAALPAVAPVTDQVVGRPTFQAKAWPNAEREAVQIYAAALLMRRRLN